MRTDEILAANARDLEAGESSRARRGAAGSAGARPATGSRQIAAGVRKIAALPDPVGEVIDGQTLPNGLQLRRVRVPLGVVAVVYEARPNVTIDAAALCLKSGNAIVLRGSSSAAHSNAVLAGVAAQAAAAAGLPEGAISLVAGGGREELAELATQTGVVDLIIPRGGEGLKAALKGVATVPVIYAASGNNHVFVDAERRPRDGAGDRAQRQAPASRRLQRRRDAARARRCRRCVPAGALRALHDGRGAVCTATSARERCAGDVPVDAATDDDWDTEYLALELAVAVVDSAAEAIEHINRHGCGHSEAIVTRDTESARAFELGVDAACVYVNASTRFTDGGEFGMGAEIGNSTQKLHARGPIGLRELCTFKYLVEGDGQVRPSLA